MSWDSELEVASFNDVVFTVQRVSDEVMRRWAEFKYPYKDGADYEDMGAEPRRTHLTAVFIGDNATADLGAFVQTIAKGKQGTFTHPILGVWKARMRCPDITASYDFRDGYALDVEVVQDGTVSSLPDVLSIDTLQADVETKAAAVTAAAAEVADSTSSWATAFSAITGAVEAAEDFADKAASLSWQVEEVVNAVRSSVRTASTATRTAISSPTRAYETVAALHRMAYACHLLAFRITADKPVMRSYTVPVAMPTVLLAHSLYGDRKRASEIEAMNKVRNPGAIPAGTVLRVYSW